MVAGMITKPAIAMIFFGIQGSNAVGSIRTL